MNPPFLVSRSLPLTVVDMVAGRFSLFGQGLSRERGVEEIGLLF